MTVLQVLETRDLSEDDLLVVRALMDAAFEGGFSDDDWEHTLGGTHALLREGEAILAHAAVVERRLLVGDAAIRAGYVEGVATHPDRRRRGHATSVMRKVNEIICSTFDLGALSTDLPELYLPLGWERWRGPTYATGPEGPVRTEDEDEGIMVLLTERTRQLDLAQSLTCDPRSGDAW
ncbi:MAG: GNAT family N-acetyltransferase [Actinomycetota bacterium]